VDRLVPKAKPGRSQRVGDNAFHLIFWIADWIFCFPVLRLGNVFAFMYAEREWDEALALDETLAWGWGEAWALWSELRLP